MQAGRPMLFVRVSHRDVIVCVRAKKRYSVGNDWSCERDSQDFKAGWTAVEQEGKKDV